SLPEEDGIDEGNRNDEVGSGVYIVNGIRSGGNVYDVSDIGDSGGVASSSNKSSPSSSASLSSSLVG
nr:hypothetical protein [Tanacetum cinerariifolium]